MNITRETVVEGIFVTPTNENYLIQGCMLPCNTSRLQITTRPGKQNNHHVLRTLVLSQLTIHQSLLHEKMKDQMVGGSP